MGLALPPTVPVVVRAADAWRCEFRRSRPSRAPGRCGVVPWAGFGMRGQGGEWGSAFCPDTSSRSQSVAVGKTGFCLRTQDRNSSRRLQEKCPGAGNSRRPSRATLVPAYAAPFRVRTARKRGTPLIESQSRIDRRHGPASKVRLLASEDGADSMRGTVSRSMRRRRNSGARAGPRLASVDVRPSPIDYRRTRSVDNREASRGTRAGCRERRGDRAMEGRGPRFANPSRVQQWGQVPRSAAST